MLYEQTTQESEQLSPLNSAENTNIAPVNTDTATPPASNLESPNLAVPAGTEPTNSPLVGRANTPEEDAVMQKIMRGITTGLPKTEEENLLTKKFTKRL